MWYLLESLSTRCGYSVTKEGLLGTSFWNRTVDKLRQGQTVLAALGSEGYNLMPGFKTQHQEGTMSKPMWARVAALRKTHPSGGKAAAPDKPSTTGKSQ